MDRPRPASGRRYRTNRPELDATIAALASEYGGPNADVLNEMLTTAFKLVLDNAARGDLKMVNAAIKELRYAFRVFAPYRKVRKVSIFGSARTPPDDPNYKVAHDFADAICHRGWMVVTGAGPGIMEAGHLGAGAAHSFGVNIRLPFEDQANTVIAEDPKLVNFRYFFTRKVTFLKESDGFVLFPGGFGTMDEAFELLVLVQTGKSDLHPIVLVEAPGDDYWSSWEEFVRRQLLDRGLISPADLNLYRIAQDADEAVAELERFYRNYHSERYVSGQLVLRMRRAPDDAALQELNEAFADIVASGEIRRLGPSPAEIADDDALDMDRIAFRFNRRSFGRLRVLVDALNDL